MLELDKDFITCKIKRAHRVKGNKYETIPPIIAKFSGWTFLSKLNPVSLKLQKIHRMRFPYYSSVTDVISCFNKTTQ